MLHPQIKTKRRLNNSSTKKESKRGESTCEVVAEFVASESGFGFAPFAWKD